MSRQGDQRNGPGAQGGGGGGSGGGGDFLSMLQGVESQLSQLRKAHSDHEVLRAQLSSWDETLKEREEALKNRERGLQDRAGRVDKEAADIAKREAEVSKRSSELADLERRVEAGKEEVTRVSAKQRDTETALQKRESDATQRHQALDQRDRQLREFEGSLREAERKMGEQRARFERADAEFATRDRELQALHAKLEERDARLTQGESQAKERDQALVTRDDEFRRRDAAIRAREEQLIARSNVLNQTREKVANLAADVAIRERKVKQDLDQVAEFERRRVEFTQQLQDAERREFEQVERVKLLEQELASSISLTEDLEHRVTELQSGAAGDSRIKGELADARQQAQRLEQELQQSRRELERAKSQGSQELEALRSQLARASQSQQGLESDMATRLQEAQAQQERLRDALTRLRETAGQERAKAEAELADLRQRLVDAVSTGEQGDGMLRDQLTATSSRLMDLEAERNEAHESAMRSGEQVEAMKVKITELVAALNNAEERAASGAGAPQAFVASHAASGDVGELVEMVAMRRRRLNAVKDVLRQREAKLRAVSDHVRERYEQAEEVLAARAEIEKAKNLIVEVRQKGNAMQSRAAKASAAKIVALSIGALGILAGLSWAVANAVSSPTYAARSVIVASGGDRDLTEAQQQEWTNYLQSFVKDPGLLTSAAERMTRRGITSLGDYKTLKDRLDKDLDVTWDNTGQMKLELRGQGGAKTVRELETYITALVSEANATKERRADGAMTVVIEDANVNLGPVVDRRPIAAGLIWLAASLASLGAGALIWARLNKAHDKFNEEADIDHIMERTAHLRAGRNAA